MPSTIAIWVTCTKTVKVSIKVIRESKRTLRGSTARQGIALAQFNLGLVYTITVKVSIKVTRKQQNTGRGSSKARTRQCAIQFGWSLLQGSRCREQSIETACEWWMKSAEQGEELAIDAQST